MASIFFIGSTLSRSPANDAGKAQPGISSSHANLAGEDHQFYGRIPGSLVGLGQLARQVSIYEPKK